MNSEHPMEILVEMVACPAKIMVSGKLIMEILKVLRIRIDMMISYEKSR